MIIENYEESFEALKSKNAKKKLIQHTRNSQIQLFKQQFDCFWCVKCELCSINIGCALLRVLSINQTIRTNQPHTFKIHSFHIVENMVGIICIRRLFISNSFICIVGVHRADVFDRKCIELKKFDFSIFWLTTNYKFCEWFSCEHQMIQKMLKMAKANSVCIYAS